MSTHLRTVALSLAAILLLGLMAANLFAWKEESARLLTEAEMQQAIAGAACPDKAGAPVPCSLTGQGGQRSCPNVGLICQATYYEGKNICAQVSTIGVSKCVGVQPGSMCSETASGQCGSFMHDPLIMGFCSGCPDGPVACGAPMISTTTSPCP